MSQDSEQQVPWIVHAPVPPSTHKGAALIAGVPLSSDYTSATRNKAMDCDAQIVYDWLTRELPSGTLDRLRARLNGLAVKVPNQYNRPSDGSS